jgi:hypothetical protein
VVYCARRLVEGGATLRRIGQGLIGGAIALVALGAVPSMAAAADRLPDLGMARVSDVHMDNAANGRRLLRYTTVIVNVGAGRFEARGQRSSTSQTQMAAVQRIYDTAGGFREVATPAVMVFGGDGHNHWHVHNLESSDLIRLDNGSKVGTGAKHGFCFFDNTAYRLTLPGAPQSPFYLSCGNSSSLQVTMGLSVGWGDKYASTLPDQYVDVTGLSAGRYRLLVTADAFGWFAESSNANNATWVDLQMKSRGQVRILGYGPSA